MPEDSDQDKTGPDTASDQASTPDDQDNPEVTTAPTSEAAAGGLAIPDTAAAPILGDLPTIPAASELAAMMQLANIFAAADLVPKALQNKPNDVLLVLMTARDLGLSLTTAIRECHPIDGKVTASPKLRTAIVRSRGLGRIWPDPENDEMEATWYAVRADDPQIIYKSTYKWHFAQRGKRPMVGPLCQPDNHHIETLTGKNNSKYQGCRCKENYVTNPERMMSWRALGALVDDAFSEVGTGIYSPEEFGATVDEAGRVILDVEEVGVPEGMNAPQTERGRRRRQEEAAAAAAPSPPDDQALQDLRDRIAALPLAAQAALRARWVAPRSEGASESLLPTIEGKPATVLLNERTIKTAAALVKSFERDVEHGQYGDTPEPEPDARPADAMADLSAAVAESPGAAAEPEPEIEQPDPDAAYDEPDEGPDPAAPPAPTSWEEVIEAVRDLPLQEVMTELNARKLAAAGPPAELRSTLAYDIGIGAGLPEPEAKT